MENHFTRGSGDVDPPLKTERADSPESSCVSMKSDRTMPKHPDFSTGDQESSCVSMKSDRSMPKHPDFSTGDQESSCVSMKSDRSMPKHPDFSTGDQESSCVSMKSDRSMHEPPNFSTGDQESSCVSMKSDHSMHEPPNFSTGDQESSCVSMKSDRSMHKPPNFSTGDQESSCVSMKSDRSMHEPPNFSTGDQESSCVSMKSDRSMHEPPNFSTGDQESSCVSMKSDRSMPKHPDFSTGDQESSCVSMKSDRSMHEPPNFSTGDQESSCVSMKSDHSMHEPPNFSTGDQESSCVSMKSDRSMHKPPNFSTGDQESSCVSMKSDRSMHKPPNFSTGDQESSCVSMKSDRSMHEPPNFSTGDQESSCVSMKSDHSMHEPPNFSTGDQESSCVSMKSDRSMHEPPNFSTGDQESSCVSMKSDRSMHEPPNFSTGFVLSDNEYCSTKIAEKQVSNKPVQDVQRKVLGKHKTCMKKKYETLFEGIQTQENRTLLRRIYTQLYIIEGESEGVNEEHEVLQMEKTFRRPMQNVPINNIDLFKQGPKTETKKKYITMVATEKDNCGQKLRTVLTKGIAGIGKTVSVQKFVLDWAEGTANQDVDFMFVLSFRELNLIKDDQYSLHELLCVFHPELRDMDPKIFEDYKAVFILDGLDESRIPMNFSNCEKVSEISMPSSVGVLMTNLIKGDLLPSDLIWITSRPAAANQIPPQYIDRVTEIQGFNDQQKEEYFHKKITDQDQFQKIISHIKTARSLHIMCHIPVFCWISATVLQRFIKQNHTEIPKTLTEMYSHFLLTQINMKNEKYEEKSERDPQKLMEANRTMLLKLAELAFKQLMKGNVMFYEEDLRESGIDVTEASVYSGFVTEIFREECVLYQRKVYCFVHLSFQEFLAAVYVIHCYEKRKLLELECCKSSQTAWFVYVSLEGLLKEVVDKALKSQNGHLDLFLRFLLGISLESNQKDLQGLLTGTHTSSKKTTEYIKTKIKGDNKQYHATTERSINLFLCLSELKDQSLSSEIEEFVKSEKHSKEMLSPGQCSALACMLLSSDEVLGELDLKNYNTTEEGYMRLIPAVTACRKARLANCNLGEKACEALSSMLQSVNSSLKELDLSNNDLQDSGVELLSAGLKSSHCKLQILRLPNCNLGEKACEALSSMQSVNLSLKELDLSNNDLQDSGVELLSAGLKSSHCKLETLRLSGCMVTEKGCSFLASALKSNPSHLRELDLTYNHVQQYGEKLLADLLKDKHFKLEKLLVKYGGSVRMKPGLQKYAYNFTLDPHTVHTRLSLSEGDSKVTVMNRDQSYPDRPDRFENCQQVLSVESLTGRCYWEAEWKGHGAAVAMSYRGISRKGRNEDCVFGNNHHSWSLEYCNSRLSVKHNNQKTVLPAPPCLSQSSTSSRSNRAGVYLDSEAGTLSFYSVSPETHTLTHLHTFSSTFTEPLYGGFRIWNRGSSVHVIKQAAHSSTLHQHS